LLPRQFTLRPSFRPQQTFHPSRTFTTAKRKEARALPSTTRRPAQGTGSIHHGANPSQKPESKALTDVELENIWAKVKVACDDLLALTRIPAEEETSTALAKCNSLADYLAVDHSLPKSQKNVGATSALLSLDESSSTNETPANKLPALVQHTIDNLSSIAYHIVKHPLVFITPQVLAAYTNIQAKLGKAQTFPEVFHMYANKPSPQGTSTITYSKQNPNKVSNSIPLPLADRALQTAIYSKELNAAIGIVESAYTTKAAHRAKFVRKCLLPATGVAVAPVAAYTIASQLAVLQTTMDAAMATNVAFVGILAYTFFTGTIGVVAVTTANDQMERVTWAPGMPLRERWIREEERAAIDKIAVSWGFREIWRRGEEEGEDWDALREWIGGKGMILDRVELMEGME
jgi:hypothetical protein